MFKLKYVRPLQLATTMQGMMSCVAYATGGGAARVPWRGASCRVSAFVLIEAGGGGGLKGERIG